MLVLFRHHQNDCKYEKRSDKKCDCPIWYDWRVGSQRFRRSLKTRNWQVANIKAREMEANGAVSSAIPTSLKEASEKFLADGKARGLSHATVTKYKQVLNPLEKFAEDHGLVFLSQFNPDNLSEFRGTWTNKNTGARKKLEHLKTFFRFCLDMGWIAKSPAAAIKPPKDEGPDVETFEPETFEKILAACENKPHQQTAERAAQLKALVLLMRHSGLRIGDAVTLLRSRISGDMLELRTTKTKTKVRLPLPKIVLDALTKLPANGDYYFWSGRSTRKTCITIWEQTFKQLFKRAGLPGAHSHQFRHTFATDLLSKGVSLESVSQLLGHRSVRITERFYSHWIVSRQSRLENEVRTTWKNMGTPRAHPQRSIKKHR